MPLSRQSEGIYQETSSHATCPGKVGQTSQLAEPLWTDPGLKSEISLRKLISTLKKKSAGREWIVKHSPKILTHEKKPAPSLHGSTRLH